MSLEGHFCWEDCDEGPHGCICGNDCTDPRPAPADQLRERLLTLFAEHGFSKGQNPHSWRCEHPDRYPDYCDCAEDLVNEVVKLAFALDVPQKGD